MALGVFAVVTLLFFFPLLRGQTFSDVAGREQGVYPWAGAVTGLEAYKTTLHYDQDDSVYPWQVFMNRELRAGRFPLWNPYSFGGAPFFANGQSGVLYPPRLALAYTVPPARVHDGLLVAHFFGAGIAMFTLLTYLGLAFPARLVGALAWMLNTFALSWQALEHYVVIEVGLPIGVLLAHVAVTRRSWPATWALAVVLGLISVGGNVLFVELAVLTIVAYGVTRALAAVRREPRRALTGVGMLCGAAALALGLAAVAFLPTIKLAGESARISLSYGQLSSYSLSWSDLQYVFRPPKDPYKFDPYHWDLFAGSLVGVLALCGVFARSLAARFAASAAVLTLLFMLHTPVTYAVIHLLPGFGNFKPLARAAFVLQFALAILAAYGLQLVLRRMSSARYARLRSARAAAALVGVVIVSVGIQEWLWKRDVMVHQPATPKSLYPQTPLVRDLEDEAVTRFLPTTPSFRGSTAMIFQLPSAGGYESLLPARTQDFWRVLGDRLNPATLAAHPLIYAYHPGYQLTRIQPGLLARASVSHVFAAPADVVTAPVPHGLQLEHGGSDGRVYRVAHALPLAYVVGACEVAASPVSALERFISDDFHPSGRVILEQRSLSSAGLSCAGGQSGRVGDARVDKRGLNTLEVGVDAQRAGWLVVAESWDSGWTATVDGRSAEVLPGDSVFRAVRVSPGEHVVRFRYRPASLSLGIAISSLSLGIAIGALGWSGWRARRRSS